MSYKKNSTALSLFDAKSAALFSDYVLPLDLSQLFIPPEHMRDKVEENLLIPIFILNKILPPQLLDSNNKSGLGDLITRHITNYIFMNRGVVSKKEPHAIDVKSDGFRETLIEFEENLNEIINHKNITIDELVGFPSRPSSDTDNVNVSLSGLRIIDTSQLSWKQVLDFREDIESQKKLRNLKLYLHDNYEGKSKEYIEDHLLLKIEEFDETVKKWGFSTVVSSLDILFSSESISTLSTAMLVGGLAGGIPVAALVGTTFTLGTVALSITKRKIEHNAYLKNAPISYLYEIKEKSKGT